MLTVLLAHVFTYASVDLPVLEVMQHPDYIFNFILNAIQIFILLKLCYRFSFRKGLPLLSSICITCLVFAIMTLVNVLAFEYEKEDYIELYSITLPFGLLLLIGICTFYHFQRQIVNSKSKKDEKKQFIWIRSSTGEKKLYPADFKYAQLQNGILKIKTGEQIMYSAICHYLN